MRIWFDMDGTLADLYSVENWLPRLRAYDPAPYAEAKPMLRLCSLAKVLNRLSREGVESIMNPYDRHALEEAVAIRERLGGK